MGIAKKIVDDLAESTRKVHEINKENIKAIKEDAKANMENAKNHEGYKELLEKQREERQAIINGK